ncbi:type IX secretion system PorP/SprF family membrane protein [Anseongella ginsenosidimutans]|uniref:Type IX secretion system PorP/SprF family membrane protein n=1 Tax=Anseongella ginsenosidimutans TaxID=496056 RepID=A0A4R3KPH9_9SPHI|nr:type IX secretion system membrane protein PorP/SprF [Anseongella ginsenosidimutans]QEC52665.1 type IX secretion system membrane protein PorP/SprF [Anseongella ginsenosidimutans]TCS86592.1 type IX secretion system PorP/SprF family membrane protein [Anseongella ginsenosidimutans]
MKRFLLAYVLLFITAGLKAQQQPQYTMYMANNFVLNPAVAGIENYTDVKLSYRAQWVGIEDAPVTAYATIHGLIAADLEGRRHGLGGAIVLDKTGPTQRFSGTVAYGFHLPVSKNLTTAFGVSAGIMEYSLNTDALELGNPNDVILTKGNYSQMLPSVNAGIWLYSPDFFIGAAAQNLIESKLTFNSYTASEESRLYRHYFLTGGYRFAVSETLTATPSLMLKIVQPVPVSFDINFKMMYRDRFWAGLSYRKRDGFAAMAGINISPLINVSYAYDYVTSDLQDYTSGSHEIILGILLNNEEGALCPTNVW